VKLITVYLPEPYIKALDQLVDECFYPDRVEAFRVAIRGLVSSEVAERSTVSDVSLGLLKERFAVLPVFGMGDCVVIPGEEFTAGWAMCLHSLGLSYKLDLLDDHPVFFVPLGTDDRAGWKGRRPLMEVS
jgi:hypothetical protein